jgi:hypothetical protein
MTERGNAVRVSAIAWSEAQIRASAYHGYQVPYYSSASPDPSNHLHPLLVAVGTV